MSFIEEEEEEEEEEEAYTSSELEINKEAEINYQKAQKMWEDMISKNLPLQIEQIDPGVCVFLLTKIDEEFNRKYSELIRCEKSLEHKQEINEELLEKIHEIKTKEDFDEYKRRYDLELQETEDCLKRYEKELTIPPSSMLETPPKTVKKTSKKFLPPKSPEEIHVEYIEKTHTFAIKVGNQYMTSLMKPSQKIEDYLTDNFEFASAISTENEAKSIVQELQNYFFPAITKKSPSEKAQTNWTYHREGPEIHMIQDELTKKRYLILPQANGSYHLQGINTDHSLEMFDEPRKRKNQRFTNPMEFTRETLTAKLQERGIPLEIINRCFI